MIKPLKDIKFDFHLHPQESASQIKYFKSLNIDWNVYLPSKRINLQRDYVWTLDQKRELIWSVLMGRHIPHCAIMNLFNPDDPKTDLYLIIDGKQRLSTLCDFTDNKFTLDIDGEEYYFNQLPKEYQIAVEKFWFRYYVINEQRPGQIDDEMKIKWFKFLNFAGTPQDKQHLEKL